MSLPVGDPVPDLEAPPLSRSTLEGRYVTLREPHPEADASILYPVTHGDPGLEEVWTYMGYGPFSDEEAMASWIRGCGASTDPLWSTVTDREGLPLGMAAMMNADPKMRRLELGHIWYQTSAHGTPANTEATLLMLEDAFTRFRSRRVEWKCDSLNAASRRTALRMGFTFEGVFRNHMIVKGRNRDTAWYSITDAEWPSVRDRMTAWLSHPDPKPSLSPNGAG
jgi:RimJ/RimL family protein N-acetyltransferase